MGAARLLVNRLLRLVIGTGTTGTQRECYVVDRGSRRLRWNRIELTQDPPISFRTLVESATNDAGQPASSDRERHEESLGWPTNLPLLLSLVDQWTSSLAPTIQCQTREAHDRGQAKERKKFGRALS